jgi:thymidine phosphorylase
MVDAGERIRWSVSPVIDKHCVGGLPGNRIAICNAQGDLREPPHAPFHQEVLADGNGHVGSTDNRRLARAAKLAGGPKNAASGAVIHMRLGDPVASGQRLFTLHARTPGELAYALTCVNAQPPIVEIDRQCSALEPAGWRVDVFPTARSIGACSTRFRASTWLSFRNWEIRTGICLVCCSSRTRCAHWAPAASG